MPYESMVSWEVLHEGVLNFLLNPKVYGVVHSTTLTFPNESAETLLAEKFANLTQRIRLELLPE